MSVILGGVPTSTHNLSPEQLAENRRAVRPSDEFLAVARYASETLAAYIASSGLGKGFLQDPLLEAGLTRLFRTCTTRPERKDDLRSVAGLLTDRYIRVPRIGQGSFSDLAENGLVLEVNEFGSTEIDGEKVGNLYGVTALSFEDAGAGSGCFALTDFNVDGLDSFRRFGLDPRAIGIATRLPHKWLTKLVWRDLGILIDPNSTDAEVEETICQIISNPANDNLRSRITKETQKEAACYGRWINEGSIAILLNDFGTGSAIPIQAQNAQALANYHLLDNGSSKVCLPSPEEALDAIGTTMEVVDRIAASI